MDDANLPEPKRLRKGSPPRRPLTEARREKFLGELRTNGGLVRRAAQAASPHSTGARGALQTFRDEAARNPEFRAAWEDAEADGLAALESEAVRRAYSGWQERPILDKDGNTRGHVHKYSDRLMEIILKAKLPEYRDRAYLDVNADAHVDASVRASVDVRLTALMREMTNEELGEMQGYLEGAARLYETVEHRLAVEGRALQLPRLE
jgi:hypothetical protein